jgi:hypothetical protein
MDTWEFFSNFSQNYPGLAQDIFFLNSEKSLETLTNFEIQDEKGAMIEESEETKRVSFDINDLPRMSSFNIISLIIKSCPWLYKVSNMVEYLKEIQQYEESNMLDRI